ncbi:MAG: hypothetical protein ABIO05_00595 [Ferruginibacter sp.]
MKNLLLTLIIFLSGMVATAQETRMQDPQKKEEKIKALYVAFISQQLKLTEDEAQKFWPVHTQFDGEIRSVNPELPELDRQQTSLNIKKKYQDRFTRIIGAERTDAFFRSDTEFRKKLIERLKNSRQQNFNRTRQMPGKN